METTSFLLNATLLITALLPEIPEGGYVNLDYTYWLAESSSFAEVLL